MPLILELIRLHTRTVARVQTSLGPWFTGLMARVVFAGVLLVYFGNAAMQKIDPGLLGALTLRDGAYVQMFPKVMEGVGYDVSAIPTHLHVIAYVGTYAEFLLPLLIVVGLFTRVAALGMIGFVLVQSFVDITGHSVSAATIGTWFDRVSGAAILDQRALWAFLLLTLVVHGPGKVSVDHVLGRRFFRYGAVPAFQR